MRKVVPLLVLALAFATAPLRAVETSQTAAVDAEATELVRSTLVRYFAEAKLAAPEPLAVITRADIAVEKPFDAASGDAGAPKLKGLTIEVAMTTDHPANVMLGARNFLTHELEARGYRFGGTDDDADLRIPATVTFRIDAPIAAGGLTRYGVKPLLTFGALVLGALAFLLLALGMTRRALRQTPRPKPHHGPVGEALPEVFGSGEPSVHGAVEKVATAMPSILVREAARLPPELEALAQELAAMPLERAMHLLGAVSTEDREKLFERMNLHQSVRRRVERELVASGRATPDAPHGREPELGPLPT